MKICLVDNLVMPDSGNLALLDTHPHLGLLSIAAVAVQHGHNVQIFDPKREVQNGTIPYNEHIYDHVAKLLLASDPDVVGFSTLGCSFIFVLNVAYRLNALHAELPILLGGPHATMLHREIMDQFPQFDVVVRFEAEQTFPQVLERLDDRNFFGIPGITWRNAGRVWETPGKPQIDDLDSLPTLSYDYYPVESLGLDLLRIEAGRGCPFACTFCSTAEFFQRSFRLKSAERLVSELDVLNERYGYTEFKLDHDLFTVSREKVRDFCAAVKNRGYQWRVSARVDCVNEQLLEQMADSGCCGIYFGIEAGSARMQKITQKRLKLELVNPTVKITERLGIEATLSFITGYPQELQSDQNATLDLLGESFQRKSSVAIPQLHILEPEPGTPLFTEYKDQMLYDGFSTNFNAALLGKYDQSIVLDNPTIFPNYFYYPSQIPRRHQTFAVDFMDLIRPLDAIVVQYLLRFFNGQLSQLVAEIREWFDELPLGFSELSLLDFMAERLGQSHHVCSLIKYNLSIQTLRETLLDQPLALPVAPYTEYQTYGTYKLLPNALLLSEVHDCAHILKCIQQASHNGILSDTQTGGLENMLILVQDDRISNIIVKSEFYCLLKMFKDGLVGDSLIGAIGAKDQRQQYKELFQSVLDLGVLTTANSIQTPAREVNKSEKEAELN